MLKNLLAKITLIFESKEALNSLKVLVFRVFGVFILFGFTLFLTNNFSPDIVGKYDFIRTFLLVIGSLCLVGFDQSILYFSGIYKGQNNFSKIIKTYFWMIIMVFITSILAIILFLFLNENVVNDFLSDTVIYQLLLYSILILFFYCLTVLNTEVFRALDRVYLSEFFRNIVKYMPVIIGAIYVYLTKVSPLYIIYFFLFGFVLIGLISFIVLIFSFKKRIDIKESMRHSISRKVLINKSYPISISGVAIFLLMSIDVFLLKKFHGDKVVAFYSVTLKLLLILSMIINSINISISSRIAELFESKDFSKLESLLRKCSRMMTLISLPIVFFIVLFPDFILSFFGDEYIKSKYALMIIIISQGICTLFGGAAVYLNMTGRQKLFQNILLMSVGINLILNIILIPKYSMIGAAISFSVSLFFWNLITAITVYKKDKIKLFIY